MWNRLQCYSQLQADRQWTVLAVDMVRKAQQQIWTTLSHHRCMTPQQCQDQWAVVVQLLHGCNYTQKSLFTMIMYMYIYIIFNEYDTNAAAQSHPQHHYTDIL